MKIDALYTSYYANTYILHLDNGVYIIDAGVALKNVKNVIGGEKVLGILITHSHYDHIKQIYKYLDEYNCPLYISKYAKDIYSNNHHNASDLFREPIEFDFSEYNVIKVEDGYMIDGIIKCIENPGHTKDSTSYMIDDTIFTGDFIFKVGTGRCDLYSGNIKEMDESISKFFNMIDGKLYKLYPGHGEVTNSDYELLANSYVRNVLKLN